MLKPFVVTVTANLRIAPIAIRSSDVPKVMGKPPFSIPFALARGFPSRRAGKRSGGPTIDVAYAMLGHMTGIRGLRPKLHMRKPTSLALLALLATACGTSSSSSSTGVGSAQGGPHGTVSVLYAGSLVNLMEHDLGPAFAR